MEIINCVRRTVRRHALLPAGSQVAVALSGGADSVGLTLVLAELASAGGFQLSGVLHLNHQLRGAASDADEAFCRLLADRLGLPIEAERVDIASVAASKGVSIEQAAHIERYAFYERAAARLNASSVAVAHTKDDQAETFLLRLLRGAGPRGLSGMHPRSGIVVRPLLDTSRAEVRAFLDARRETFRNDSTNLDVDIPRNRIRHELLPLLDARFGRNIVDVLDREATIAREDAEYLEAAARAASDAIVRRTAATVEIDRNALVAQPAALARRVVLQAQREIAGERHVGFDAVESLLAFAVSKLAGPLDLPGHRVHSRGGTLVLTPRQGRGAAGHLADFTYQLEVPGQVSVPEAACAISAAVGAVPEGQRAREFALGPGDQAIIEATHLAGPLLVRNRRPGDRFRPLGLNGRKKLQDYFVDAKIDRLERLSTPVVVDANGRIIWVAGHALAEEFRVTDTTRDVVILTRVPI